MNRGADIWNSSVRSFPLVRICRTRSGSWNGRPFRKRALLSEKVAVFSPNTRARVITPNKPHPGHFTSWRRHRTEHGDLSADQRSLPERPAVPGTGAGPAYPDQGERPDGRGPDVGAAIND